MKLEEVLPAMREGRIAIYAGFRYRLKNREIQFAHVDSPDEWMVSSVRLGSAVASGDKWTLEPEPKVEWPKGSLGWAINKITENTHICGSVRRRDGRFFDSKPMTYEDALALDWDVL